MLNHPPYTDEELSEMAQRLKVIAVELGVNARRRDKLLKALETLLGYAPTPEQVQQLVDAYYVL